LSPKRVLLVVHAVRGAATEALLVHAVNAVHYAGLAHVQNHLASAEARLERDVRCAVVVVGGKVHAVLRSFFGVVRAESEKLAARDARVAVGVDHAAHAAVIAVAAGIGVRAACGENAGTG